MVLPWVVGGGHPPRGFVSSVWRLTKLLNEKPRTRVRGPPQPYRDMWDRLTAPTPTVTLESTFRQPIRRFTVSRPPVLRLSFHLCFRVVPVVCVFVPCGIFRGSCPSEWSRERSAPSSVARVCRLTPPYTRTTLCRLSLLHHRRRWVSLTYHAYGNGRPPTTTLRRFLYQIFSYYTRHQPTNKPADGLFNAKQHVDQLQVQRRQRLLTRRQSADAGRVPAPTVPAPARASRPPSAVLRSF